MKKTLLLYFVFCAVIVSAQIPDLSLNGEWMLGTDRNYNSTTIVPGIATDPAKMNDGKLWYKRTVTLPKGDWTHATLVLMGARFAPEVYVNGIKVSQQNGGMTATFHLLKHKSIAPGKQVVLEVALTSLRDLSPDDASYIPKADQWRSNCSSSLWDDVFIHFHNDKRIQRLVPYYDTEKKTIDVRCDFKNLSNNNKSVKYKASILDLNGKTLLTANGESSVNSADIHFNYENILTEWTPDNPQLYQLKVELVSGKRIVDSQIQNIGIKTFTTKNKQFYLNGKPSKMRGGTVVWHRWVRSEEGKVLGYNSDWFAENVVKRLKDHGANMLRFHLGVPPRRLLDLCDKYGLLVQYEWSFFHGMPATYESLMEQYPNWFDLATKHPSIANYHPYNETEGDQLNIVWDALDKILPNYPPYVLEERDVIHVHKYWWSLFENVGIYYDDASQFDKTIMVDEFGGNYLDEKGDLGGYRSLKESFLRFLGRKNSVEERLAFQAITNGKVAEYWRRINAGGVAPFVIASSWEDGNTWFMGKLSEGNPKPVWNSLTALYSPQAVSLDIWDRNFLPGQKINIPLFFFNDTGYEKLLKAKITVEDKWGKIYSEVNVGSTVSAFEQNSIPINIQLPDKEGVFILKAELLNRPENVKYPVVSAWEIRTIKTKIPEKIKDLTVAVTENEPELEAMLVSNGINLKSITDKDVKVIISSLTTWKRIAEGDLKSKKTVEDAVQRGVSVILLDIGERNLGQGYPEKEGNLGNLQGLDKVLDPKITHYEIFDGLDLICTEAPEPESHIHADPSNNQLWFNLPRAHTWLWNGLRGGLNVPSSYIEITGLSQEAFAEQWKARGADADKIKSGSYYAYELQGFYRFSTMEKDVETEKKLKEYVAFLVEDAPALASAINPLTPIQITNLSARYEESKHGKAKKITILANAGKNLTRTPVLMVDFGEGKGKILLSQLLTAGRLSPEFGEKTKYGIRYDETAVQMVMNMIEAVNPNL